jgi:hypothetical protein
MLSVSKDMFTILIPVTEQTSTAPTDAQGQTAKEATKTLKMDCIVLPVLLRYTTAFSVRLRINDYILFKIKTLR